jgi:tetratricopeptide (TPR) repeat protein
MMVSATSIDYLFSSALPSATQYDSLSASALGRAIDRYTEKDYDKAIREFRRCIALSPYSENSLKAFEYLVNTLDKTGKTDEAIKACQQSIKIFPSADGMNVGLGNLLYAEGRYTEATEQYKAAVSKNPTASQNVYSLGQGYLSLGRYNDAEAQFKKSIQLSPKDSGGYYALGKTYRKVGRLEEAQAQLEKAIGIKNDFADAHFELGMVYAETGQADKADSELEILNEESSSLATELATKIYETTEPRLLSASSSDIYLGASAETEVWSLDSVLESPGATKCFTVNFVFSKYMDAASAGNMSNWSINRSTEYRTGGLYNWGKITGTDVNVSSTPVSVNYDPETLTAMVTFSITQNATGDGTVDISHLVFKFNGVDEYGNAMDPDADEYSNISRVV